MAQEDCLVYISFLANLHFRTLLPPLAETARLPFDLPEAEGELVAGYIVELCSGRITHSFLLLNIQTLYSAALSNGAAIFRWLQQLLDSLAALLPSWNILAFCEDIYPF
jgi:NADH:ubiquinone oxidoreductase subunit H